MEKKEFKIISKKLKKDELYFILSPLDGKNIKFKPGQFVKITSLKKQEDPKSRFYSIASSPNSNNLEFIVQVVGRFTNHLASLNEGDGLEIEGPYGHFSFSGEKKGIFIAGGVGVAPLLSILRYIDEEKIEGNYTLFLSNRTPEFPFKEELDRLSKNPSINLVLTITRETPANWKGELGRINKEMILKYLPNLEEHTAFMCGPTKMILSMKSLLIELGMDGKNIKFESWG